MIAGLSKAVSEIDVYLSVFIEVSGQHARY